MQYQINNTIISYEAEGQRQFGSEHILLQQGLDLTSKNSWGVEGFTIETLFSSELYKDFKKEVSNLLMRCWHDAGLQIPESFSLQDYHTLITKPELHLAAIDKTKLLNTSLFPLGISEIERRISTLCGVNLKAKNPYDGESIFHFRVIRPKSRDNNPLHRDVWLEDYDNCINLYIPIAGSNELSSLILFPGSHYWPESKIEKTILGAIINGVKFNVPAVTAINGDYSIERPSPKENEVLVFSPYLIHGGSVNLNDDQTRISIELRLWKV